MTTLYLERTMVLCSVGAHDFWADNAAPEQDRFRRDVADHEQERLVSNERL